MIVFFRIMYFGFMLTGFSLFPQSYGEETAES